MEHTQFTDERGSRLELSPLRLYDLVAMVGIGSFLLGTSAILLLDQALIHLDKNRSSSWQSLVSAITSAIIGLLFVIVSSIRVNRLIGRLRSTLLNSAPPSLRE
jgi:hypothetical protein